MQPAQLTAAEDIGPSWARHPFPLTDGLHIESWRSLDLTAIDDSWKRLAETASTPNAFFEASFLRPSLALFDSGGEVHLALLTGGESAVRRASIAAPTRDAACPMR